MNFLSPILLSISSNLYTLTAATSYGGKKIHMPKSSIMLIAIITSLGTFISMCAGNVIGYFLGHNLSNIFGSVILSLIGIYFIVEYIRIEKKHRGEDTSYYVESTSKYKEILENPNIVDADNSGEIDIQKSLILSFSLTTNNISVGVAASITGVNIALSVFFNFVFTIISIYLGYFISNSYLSKLFTKYGTLISGIILIIIGIYETFI